MIRFEIDNLHIDPDGLRIREEYQAILNIGATLSIYLNQKLFFKEEGFTVVELAQQLSQWLKTEGEEFIFKTMDDDVENLIMFKKSKGGWIIFSEWQEYSEKEIFTYDELKDFTENFIKRVKYDVFHTLGIDLDKIVPF